MSKSKLQEILKKHSSEEIMQAVYDLWNMSVEEVPLTEEEIATILYDAGYTSEELEKFSDKIKKLAIRELAKMKKKIEEETNE